MSMCVCVRVCVFVCGVCVWGGVRVCMCVCVCGVCVDVHAYDTCMYMYM